MLNTYIDFAYCHAEHFDFAQCKLREARLPSIAGGHLRRFFAEFIPSEVEVLRMTTDVISISN